MAKIWVYHFWTDSNKNSTIFFPRTGYMTNLGKWVDGSSSIIWTAVPNNPRNATNMYFYDHYVIPLRYFPREFGYSVRPVSE